MIEGDRKNLMDDKLPHRTMREVELADGSPKFSVFIADPPWPFDDALPGDTRGAERNYECMSLEAIKNMPLPPLTDDATLGLWRVAAMQREALDVVDAWGFTLKTEIVWLKKTRHGKRWFGMGRTVRAEHEVCLIATRGRPETLSHSVRSTIITDFDFAGLSAHAVRHSQKPEEFYEAIEQIRSGPYVEYFARRRRPGWACFGKELETL